MKKVIIITGPTAVGKTKISIEVAKRLNTPLINGDAYQAYVGLDIITAKPTKEEQSSVKHYLMNELDPNVSFTIYEYQKKVRELINQIDIPIIVGGSGLYIDSVIYDYKFIENNEHLDFNDKTNEELKEILNNLDLDASLKIPTNNRRRLIRQIELYYQQEKSERQNKDTKVYDAIIINLSMDRIKLYDRINERVIEMIDNGLIDEVKNSQNLEDTLLSKAIGYSDAFDYLNQKITKEELIKKIQTKSRHYAKRQLTWFRNHPDTISIDVDMNNIDSTIDEVYNCILNYIKSV